MDKLLKATHKTPTLIFQENFSPSFAEISSKEQFYFKDDVWVSCSESQIMSLWQKWVTAIGVHRYWDKNGFLVYGYKI